MRRPREYGQVTAIVMEENTRNEVVGLAGALVSAGNGGVVARFADRRRQRLDAEPAEALAATGAPVYSRAQAGPKTGGKRRGIESPGPVATNGRTLVAGGEAGLRAWSDDPPSAKAVAPGPVSEVAISDGFTAGIAYWLDSAGNQQSAAI